jgi:hypothetical protein
VRISAGPCVAGHRPVARPAAVEAIPTPRSKR